MTTREESKAITQCIDQIVGVTKKLLDQPSAPALSRQFDGLHRRLTKLLEALEPEDREEFGKYFDQKVLPLMENLEVT